MRHVGASPPADSAAGASSLCSSSQTRAAAAKATTHPRSESGKSMRREFEGVPYNTGDPVYSRAPGPVSFTRTSTLVALTQHSLWWRVGPSVARSLSRPGRADGGRSVSDDGGRDKNRILACVGRCILAPTAILGHRIICNACALSIISPETPPRPERVRGAFVSTWTVPLDRTPRRQASPSAPSSMCASPTRVATIAPRHEA